MTFLAFLAFPITLTFSRLVIASSMYISMYMRSEFGIISYFEDCAFDTLCLQQLLRSLATFLLSENSYISRFCRRPFSDSIKKKRKIHERVQYVGRQLLSELGPWQWRSLEFGSLMLFLLVCWWVRLYLHYLAQYAFLRGLKIPVNRYGSCCGMCTTETVVYSVDVTYTVTPLLPMMYVHTV